MLLNENKDNKLNAIIINNSQNNENDQSNAKFAGTYKDKQKGPISAISRAMTENPANLPK